MKVLITGGQGDIAQAIANYFNVRLGEKVEVLTPGKDDLNVSNDLMVRSYFSDRKIDVLINCAGYIEPKNILDSEIDIWEKHIFINLLGSYYCAKYALENGTKTIINIGSSAGIKGKAEWSAYCAAKAGVISFTESLAAEGHDAYCISMGRTKSKMRKKLCPDEDQNTLLDPHEIGCLVWDILTHKYYAPGDNIYIRKVGDHVETSITNR